MKPPRGRFVRFDGWTLDAETGELSRGGERTRLQAQPLQLLEALLERPGELLTREELVARLWPRGVVDFETGLNTIVRRLRAALHDDADAPRYVETLPRRGYRFIGRLQGSVTTTSAAGRTQRIGAEETTTRTECLIVLHAPKPETVGERHALDAERTTIGRETNNDVVLASPSVSRRHARIERRHGALYIIDQDSTNGILLNAANRPLREERLEANDELSIGDWLLRYLAGPDVEGQHRGLLAQAAMSDSLTGLASRSRFDALAAAALREAGQRAVSMSLTMLTIDRLAGLDDRYGELAASSVLRGVAACLRRRLRPGDTAARFDSRVLSVLMPDTSLAQAASTAEALRAEIEGDVLAAGRKRIRVTLSAGVTSPAPGAAPLDAFAAALRSLQAAIDAGGNRVA